MEGKAPAAFVEPGEFNEVMKRLDKIDEKIEFVNSEVAQRIGKKVGRDIGILYGAVMGLLLFLIYASISSMFM
jgi:tetrahydromethanopterin S-methyltransferase subunit G